LHNAGIEEMSRYGLLFLVAVSCGLTAAFFTARRIEKEQQEAGNIEKEQQETVMVLVAVKDLGQGEKLDKPEEMFIVKPFPKELAPPEYIDDVKQLKGKVLQFRVKAGTHITRDDITCIMSVELPIDQVTGERFKAIAIKISPEIATVRLLQRGDHVDIIAVEKLPNGEANGKLLLQDVLVVAAEGSPIRPTGDIEPVKPGTIAVAVKSKDAVMLAEASERAKFTVALRDPDDHYTGPIRK